jgi:hypothetical protein
MKGHLSFLVLGFLAGVPVQSDAGEPKAGKPAAENPDAATSSTSIEGKGAIKALNFKNLAGFKYEYPYEEPKGKPWELQEQFEKRVPEHIRKLNGSKVALKGFMLPVETKKDRVTKFLLMADQSSCCFGKIPEPNEWVVVDMTAKEGGPILMDQLVEIDGKIEVEEKWEEGFFVGIYHISANTVQKSK